MIGKDKRAARIGLAAHTAVLFTLISSGCEVFQPLGDHLRYDVAYYLEETGELIRIQCKSAQIPEKFLWCALMNAMLGKWVFAWNVPKRGERPGPITACGWIAAKTSFTISTFSRDTKKWRVSAQSEPLDSSYWVYA